MFFMTKVTFHSTVFAKLTHLISEHFAGLAGIIASAGDEKKQIFLLRISQTDAEFTVDYNTLSLCSFYQRGHEIVETTHYDVGESIAQIHIFHSCGIYYSKPVEVYILKYIHSAKKNNLYIYI